MNARSVGLWMSMASALLIGATSQASLYAGSQKTTRWGIACRSADGSVSVIGQVLENTWHGGGDPTRNAASTVRSKRGVLVLERDGKKVRVDKPDILSDGYIAGAVCDAGGKVFTFLRESWLGSGNTKCYRATIDGVVTSCQLPAGYKFKSTEDYLWDEGRKLRYVDLRARPWKFWEVDLVDGSKVSLEEGLSTMYMAVKTPESGVDETLQYGGPSPDGSKAIRIIPSGAEIRTAQGTRTIDLSGNIQIRSEPSPLVSNSCAGWVDSAMVTPIEVASLAWSHDSGRVYWCGIKKEVGFVVDASRGTSISGPCLRGATWSADDQFITGISDCGHKVGSWKVEAK